MPGRALKNQVSATRLRLPTNFFKWDDWTAGQTLFVAFMFQIIRDQERPFKYDYQYTISERDMLIICNVPAFVTTDNWLQPLRRLFRIGHFPGYYTIEWLPNNWTYRIHDNAVIKMKCQYGTIRHQKCSEIWYYIRSRMLSPDFFLEDEMTGRPLTKYYDKPRLEYTDASMLSLRPDLWKK